MGYIYKITNLINQKSYIGQTIQPVQHRWNQHISSSYKEEYDKKKYAIHYALEKYGKENFSFEILEKVESTNAEDLNDREKFWIKESHSHYSEHGYNLTWGGEGAVKVSTEEVMSLWNKGYILREIAEKLNICRKTCSVHLQDAGVTPEEIHKRCVEYNTTTQYGTIYQCDFNGNIIQIWNSYTEIEETSLSVFGTKWQRSLISNCINNKVYSAYNYIWTRDVDDINERIRRLNNRIHAGKSKVVIQMTLEDQFIQEWPSAAVAAKFFQVDPEAISRCCRGQSKSSQGFHWKYK